MSNNARNYAEAVVSQIAEGSRMLGSALSEGARDLPVLRGMSSRGESVGPFENKLVEARRFLIDSGRIYRQGLDIVMADGTGQEGRLTSLYSNGRMDSNAPRQLANIFICGDDERQYPPPANFVSTLLQSQPTLECFPEIRIYSRSPVFDENFCLCGPGYHASSGIMVHGPEIEPVEWTAPQCAVGEDCIPPHLRRLLSEFCFASLVDRVNYLGLLLTGILCSHFVECGKGIALIDGNQPGLGKTLLVRILSIICDNADPITLRFTSNEDELRKELCASMRGSTARTILFDNAKVGHGAALNSPTIEAQCISPEIQLRILGVSDNFKRQNDCVWAVTMNSTVASPDLISRSLPVRLQHEGDPRRRQFGDVDPTEYSRRFRHEILAELYGMISVWSKAGRPQGIQPHRCSIWAKTIGGILRANNLLEFLTNMDQAGDEFNSQSDNHSALLEVIERRHPQVIQRGESTITTAVTPLHSLTASELVACFVEAQVSEEQLRSCKNSKGRATWVGKYLATQIDRPIRTNLLETEVTAIWKSSAGRGNSKRYHVVLQPILQNSIAHPSGFANPAMLSGSPLHCDPHSPAVAPAGAGAVGSGNSLDW